MPPRARILTEADLAIWSSYARLIAPLPGRSAAAADPSQREPPAAAAAVLPPRPVLSAATRTPRSIPTPVSIGDEPAGLDSATWQRFRSGKLPVARTLDLHGLTVQRAFHALISFLRNAHAARLRCVEIVTGRGNGENGGAIRRELPHWLNLPEVRPMVLGAAHPHALNPGSVRLLLRRLR